MLRAAQVATFVKLPASLRSLLDLGITLRSLLSFGAAPPPVADDAATTELLRRAQDARRLGRPDDAAAVYRQVLQSHRAHLGALRGMRELAVEGGRWREALDLQQRIFGAIGSTERSPESEWLAVIYYELGRADVSRANAGGALGHFKSAVRADRLFLPAALALGDAYELTGDHREAVRSWERAAEHLPALPLLARLERAYRQEGRPSRIIALYRTAAERAPDDLALAVALGRVFFELEMLDEAADQFEKVEVRVPGSPVVHALLGAVFERRGETREAFDEYRRALQLGHAFDWPHRCSACGAMGPMWQDRCAQCQRWNTLHPVRA
jgi:lipopolysaccharide biosynthesis regulator YciM